MSGAWQSGLGLLALLGLAWAASENRRAIAWRTVVAGVALQLLLAVLLLRFAPARAGLLALNEAMLAVQRATRDGTAFVFGYLGGGAAPFPTGGAGSSFVLAFQALPLVLVVSALSALLFHWRILPLLVSGFARLLERSMGVGGALGVSASANVFVGMVEAPLLIRPWLRDLGRGELFAVMTCGMATVAGTVMVLYASVLAPVVPDALGHVVVASLISAPAALAIGALMVPQAGPPTPGSLVAPEAASGAMDAVTRGTVAGAALLINIVALLVVLVALVSLANIVLGAVLPDGAAPATLQGLLGLVMTPLVWLAGVPWDEAAAAGALMGTKTVLNEFVAYLDLAALPPDLLSERSRLIMTYALCGFANFGSLGIMIGGLGTMVPERRAEIVSLGMRSIVAGTLATLATGATVGLVW